MWVMLLWAITSPGQEKTVYSFLVNGGAPNSESAEITLPGHQTFTGSEAAVSWDAQHSPFILLQPGTAVVQLLRVFTFSPESSAEHATPAPSTAAVLQVVRVLAVSVIPNAP